MTRSAAIAAVALLAAAAPPPAPLDPDLAHRLAGRTADAPQDCLTNLNMVSGPAVYHGALLYGSGRRVYLNRLNNGCQLMRAGDAIRVDVFGGQLCRGDRVTPFVASTGIVRPTCILGAFEPYQRPDRDRPRHQDRKS